VHPDRDQAWFEKETRNMSRREIAQELECNFNMSGETVFAAEDLEVYINMCKEPKYKTGFDRNLWIWEQQAEGQDYFISADVARGDGKDYSTALVFKTSTMEVVAEYKGKVVLGDLKTSNGPYYSRWPGPSTPKNEYGKRRAGFMKYQKCQMQMAAYALALEHTVKIIPELIMTFVATRETTQVFVIQGITIDKYKQKWKDSVAKYYGEILPAKKAAEVEMEAIDGDSN